MKSPSRVVLAALRQRADLGQGSEAIRIIEAASDLDGDAVEHVAVMKQWMDSELGAGSKLMKPQRRAALIWWEAHLDELDAAAEKAARAADSRLRLGDTLSSSVGGAVIGAAIAEVQGQGAEERHPIAVVRVEESIEPPRMSIGNLRQWSEARLRPYSFDATSALLTGPFPSLDEIGVYAHGIMNLGHYTSKDELGRIRLLRVENGSVAAPTLDEIPEDWMAPGEAFYWTSRFRGRPGGTFVFTTSSCEPDPSVSGFHEHTEVLPELLAP